MQDMRKHWTPYCPDATTLWEEVDILPQASPAPMEEEDVLPAASPGPTEPARPSSSLDRPRTGSRRWEERPPAAPAPARPSGAASE